jgi:hypothetical protein
MSGPDFSPAVQHRAIDRPLVSYGLGQLRRRLEQHPVNRASPCAGDSGAVLVPAISTTIWASG